MLGAEYFGNLEHFVLRNFFFSDFFSQSVTSVMTSYWGVPRYACSFIVLWKQCVGTFEVSES